MGFRRVGFILAMLWSTSMMGQAVVFEIEGKSTCTCNAGVENPQDFFIDFEDCTSDDDYRALLSVDLPQQFMTLTNLGDSPEGFTYNIVGMDDDDDASRFLGELHDKKGMVAVQYDPQLVVHFNFTEGTCQLYDWVSATSEE